MPIIVGTISNTQNLTSLSTESVNRTFIELQKSFATKIENCYVVDNSEYVITKWENGSQIIVGSDQWHWNQNDMLNIGVNVGETMLDSEYKKQILFTVEKRLCDGDDSVVFVVRDNGIGILASAQEQIFVPFFTTKKQGSGIGLALCKQIVVNHGGSIELFSEENDGCTVICRLPL